MKRNYKINLIGSMGEDLKESIDNLIFIMENNQADIDELKKDIKKLKEQK